MARPAGRTNDDYQQRRVALIDALSPAILKAGERPSLRDLADAAGVQPNTLRHYFGDRAGVVAAVLERAETRGEPYLSAVGQLHARPLAAALHDLLLWVIAGWTDDGLGGLHAGALSEGMGVPGAGPAYVDRVLEPTLQAFERLVQAHIDRGEIAPLDVRAAVLALVSPVLIALLHQRQLGGAGCRPLGLHGFVHQHVAAWTRGWVVPVEK